MTKKITKTDILFVLSLIAGIAALAIYLFTHPYDYDETFFSTVPYRLTQGDSLVQHEWHLTQFSSLFTYLPVKLWLTLKGSTDGIIVFLRCVYFLIHTTVTAVIYKSFRKYGNWAIPAAMIFFTQAPYRIFAISYNSMFVIFVLLCTLCFLSIHKKSSKILYVIAGACYAFACVCNPIYCCAFVLYLLACVLWTKRAPFKNLAIKIKASLISKNQKNVDKNNSDNNEQTEIFTNIKSYNCFFNKDALIFSFLGILAVVVIAASFFFATGGTINSIFENVENLLNNSEYLVTSISFLQKLKSTANFFNNISLIPPFALLLFFIVLIIDKKRTSLGRRVIYLTVSLVFAITYMFGIFKIYSFFTNFFSLPLVIFTITSYILTEKRNTKLFCCMYIPVIIAAIFQYISANTLLTPLGLVLAIGNIAGVIFTRDLFNEICIEKKSKSKSQQQQGTGLVPVIRTILCVGICAQFVFHGYVLQYDQIPKNHVKAETGPYSGIIMTQEQHQSYTKIIADFDHINALNTEKSPVLIVSAKNWIYLYNQSPMATNSAWNTDTILDTPLIAYYAENPDRIPKYIYVDKHDYSNEYNDKTLQGNMDTVTSMFEFSKEELSHGFLLTVEKTKF